MFRQGWRLMRNRLPLVGLVLLQGICAFFFVSDILINILGIYDVPLGWSLREALEIAAAVGLILGLVFGALALRRLRADLHKAEEQLDRASVAFMQMLEERFAEWRLTPAERDVALFAIKGMSLQEIAILRQTSEGTVKAQTNAIYRKAGVTGRPQLLSLIIEELMASPLSDRIARAEGAPTDVASRQAPG